MFTVAVFLRAQTTYKPCMLSNPADNPARGFQAMEIDAAAVSKHWKSPVIRVLSRTMTVVLALMAGAPGVCAEPSVSGRLAGRTFPSVFMAWSMAENTGDADRRDNMARHDLVFAGPATFGLRWDANGHEGLAEQFTTQSTAKARAFRAELLARNSNMVLLAEIRYRDAKDDFLPEDSPWWRRDEVTHKKKPGWEEGGYFLLDFHNADFRSHVARQAAAAVKSGVVDGVMLDWWLERLAEDADARIELLKAVREATGPDALVLVNSNHERIERSAPYVNGLFMECYKTKTPDDWRQIAETLRWAEANLRRPRINCVETWYHESRGDLRLMRATTALALTMSDGFCLFSDPNPLPAPDHLHDWYDFWHKGLGRPLRKGREIQPGVWEREFQHGAVFFNLAGEKPVAISFERDVKSRATGRSGTDHVVPSGDGDIFINAP